jgi:DNA-binding transcriptional MerR regulator
VKTQELLAESGLTTRQLTHWTAKGVLRPEGAGGKGNHREWPDCEVRAAKILHVLLSLGLDAWWILVMIDEDRLDEDQFDFVTLEAPRFTLTVRV